MLGSYDQKSGLEDSSPKIIVTMILAAQQLTSETKPPISISCPEIRRPEGN
jgi:hypothetical protein